jgi:hypothetical protein
MNEPTKAALKSIPAFATELEERAFWESHDSSVHMDWAKAQPVSLPNLKPTTKTISLPLPQDPLGTSGLP